MFRRIAAGGVLACLMAAAPAAIAADGSRSTLLRGETGQNRMVKVRAWDHALQIVRFNIRLSCRDGSILILEESGFLRTPVRRNGSFRDVQFGRTDTVRMRGRAGEKAVRGQLRVTDRLGKTRCDSRWVRFKAHR